MKKSLLAVALLGAFSGAAFAQSSVTVYGLIDAGISRDDNGAPAGAKLGQDSGLQNGSRLGFKGTEDLGGGLKANFVLESGIKEDTGTYDQGGLSFGRQAYVGLSGDFGSVNLGRQKSITYTISETVDPFSLGLAGNIDRLFKTGSRRDNAVTYTTTNLSGFTGSAQYAFGEVAGNNTANRTLGVSGTYAAGPVYAAIAYEKVNDANGNLGLASASAGKKLFVGGTYDFGVAKAHAAYENLKGSTSLTNLTETEQRIWMIGASVPFGASSFLVDYTRVKDENLANANAKQYALGYLYALSKRTNLYTSYSRTTNDANVAYNAGVKGGTDSLFSAGIRHLF
ncbi:porin [Undibacterium terreum]|uniref:Porin n=1 Tax=Undibacterium terreum TaxID=1224302 RepID=A0A916XL31_9BURK|nr:porin [Undibacterium terreum]GGC82757.1 porin [Undibacterium terreum]